MCLVYIDVSFMVVLLGPRIGTSKKPRYLSLTEKIPNTAQTKKGHLFRPWTLTIDTGVTRGS